MLKHTIEGFSGVKNYKVITGQVNLQAYNGWILVTDWELEKAPSSLHHSDIMTVFKFRYFVLMAALNLDRSLVRSLVCVFSDVFCSCQRHDTFHVYVSVVPTCERSGTAR